MTDLDRDAARTRRDEARPYWESVKRSDFAAYDVLSILNDADALDSRLDAAEKERDALREAIGRVLAFSPHDVNSDVFRILRAALGSSHG